jgi:hypothetical protein
MKHELLAFTMNESWNYLHNLLLGITDQEWELDL